MRRSRVVPYTVRSVTNLLATVASNVSVGHLSNFGKPTSTSHGPRLFQSSLVSGAVKIHVEDLAANTGQMCVKVLQQL